MIPAVFINQLIFKVCREVVDRLRHGRRFLLWNPADGIALVKKLRHVWYGRNRNLRRNKSNHSPSYTGEKIMIATSNIGRFLSTLTLGIVTAVGWASAQSHDPKDSLDDWMSVTRVGSFEISPDGQFFYYTSNAGDSGTRRSFGYR